AKRKADEESRQDIEALRKELGSLRETLQTLLGGEVLVERFALQAQATRMRSLPEEAPQIAHQSSVKRLSPSPAASREQVIIQAEPQTELMDRVPDRPQPPQRAGSARPPTTQQRPQRPPREPERQVQVRQQRPREDVADPGSGWWEPVLPPGHDDPRRQAYHQPVAGDPGRSLGQGMELDWTPSWEREQAARQQAAQRPQQQSSQPLPKPQPKPQAPQVSQPLPTQPGRPPRPPKGSGDSQQMQHVPPPKPARPGEVDTRVQTPVSDQQTRVRNPVRQPEPPTGVQRAVQPSGQMPIPPVMPPPVQAPLQPEPATRVQPAIQPEPAVRVQAPGQPELSSRVVQPPVDQGGGRRRADERPTADTGGRRRAPDPNEATDTGGGRRRRPDDVPSWQDSMGARSGSHSKPAPDQAPSGSHAEGKSVSELLAAYGSSDGQRRRRRREE
ncbi:MAG: DUF6779 domain-containing protein, partial [Kibdelosporangium sp.]